MVPIAQLVLDENNANKGTKRGRELLEESFEQYGAGRAVVVAHPFSRSEKRVGLLTLACRPFVFLLSCNFLDNIVNPQ
jgi:hypothetical protein